MAFGFQRNLRLSLLLWTLLAAIACTGCVRRRLTVRSNPPGALVYVDDQEIGRTPVSTYFTYYATRKISLIKEGYETLVVREKFSPPWYQVFPLDFVSENLSVRERRDERLLEFQLVPQQVVQPSQVLQRASVMRQNARQGFITSLPNTPGVSPASPFVPLPPNQPPPINQPPVGPFSPAPGGPPMLPR